MSLTPSEKLRQIVKDHTQNFTKDGKVFGKVVFGNIQENQHGVFKTVGKIEQDPNSPNVFHLKEKNKDGSYTTLGKLNEHAHALIGHSGETIARSEYSGDVRMNKDDMHLGKGNGQDHGYSASALFLLHKRRQESNSY